MHKSDQEFLNDESQKVTNTQMMEYQKELFEPSQHPIDFFNNKKSVKGYDREIDTSTAGVIKPDPYEKLS